MQPSELKRRPSAKRKPPHEPESERVESRRGRIRREQAAGARLRGREVSTGSSRWAPRAQCDLGRRGDALERGYIAREEAAGE